MKQQQFEWWYEGLSLWYNDGKYHEAMITWQTICDSYDNDCYNDVYQPNSNDDTQSYGYDQLNQLLVLPDSNQSSPKNNTFVEITTCTSLKQNNTNDNNQKQQLSLDMMSSIFLFLGSCYLDAGNMRKARKCFYHCFHCCIKHGMQQQQKPKIKTITQNQQNDMNRQNISLLLLDHKSDSIFVLAILDYIATYEEEDVQNDPSTATTIPTWEIACEIMKFAIKVTKYWNNIYQRSPYMMSSSSSSTIDYESYIQNNKPVYDRSEHPLWCHQLEVYYPIILNEFQQLLYKQCTTTNNKKSNSSNHDNDQVKQRQLSKYWQTVGSGNHRNGSGEHDGKVVTSCEQKQEHEQQELIPDWKEIVLFGTGAQSHLAPKTCSILQQLIPKDAISLANNGGGEIIFSLMKSNTHILPHTASTNIRLTAHLGLLIPKSGSCSIRIGNEIHTWENGKVLLFDDSYEHEVIIGNTNNNNEDINFRAILLIRFWHPILQTQKQRDIVLKEAIDMKQYDTLRRYCPPIPYDYYEDDNSIHNKSNNKNNIQKEHPVMKRGMEQTICSYCYETGYQSIRLVTASDQFEKRNTFVCICGHVIK